MAEPYACPGAEEILNTRFCLENLSKDARGELTRLEADHQPCKKPACVTFKTVHRLKFEVRGGPCDSSLGKLFDGTVVLERLATAFDRDGEQRGCHAGLFEWHGQGLLARGDFSGITNAGTHRQPVFGPCQTCDARGFMEGRFCGVVVETQHDELRECQIKGTYRFRFDHSTAAQDTSITGTLEGVVICPCRA